MLLLAENSIQLVPDGSLLLHIVLILFMIAVLNATVFKPVNRILDEREKLTRGRSREAQDVLRRVEEAVTRYESALRKARLDGYSLLEQERSKAMSERQAKLSTLKQELAGSVEEEKQNLLTQGRNARAALKDEVHRIAMSISAQILGRPLSR